jgi:thioredoxin reductase (NADPH)
MSDFLYEMVIVGAGPAGISLAAEAVHAGVDKSRIIIYEKAETHSWSIRKFYPENKLVTANYKGSNAECKGISCLLDSTKAETLSYLDKMIIDNQLTVKYNQQVLEIKKLKNNYFRVKTGVEEVYTKTIAIAIGVLGKPNKPDYPIPTEVRAKTHFDVTSAEFKNSEVLVVGGGDSASEYCQFLMQEGNRVHLSYRQNEFKKMNDINLQSLLAMEERKQVSIHRSTNVEGLSLDGEKVLVKFKEGSSVLVDRIIYALGGTSPTNFLESLNIKMTKEGPSVSDFFESSEEGIFLVGDISAGKKGGSINVAFNSSHEAMKQFCKSYLHCKNASYN